jgi:hypothetical protein
MSKILCATLLLTASGAMAEGAPPGDDHPRRAARGAFDTEGVIACAMNPGEALGECGFGLALGPDGDATLVATFANGFRRTLSFDDGRFVRGDATMSGTGTDIDWRIEDGLHLIRVDDQRYEVPTATLPGPEAAPPE